MYIYIYRSGGEAGVLRRVSLLRTGVVSVGSIII